MYCNLLKYEPTQINIFNFILLKSRLSDNINESKTDFGIKEYQF
jgi:hypothetical protein